MAKHKRQEGAKTRTKIAATALLTVGTAGVAGFGTLGSFTSTTTATQNVSSGTVTIALGAAGTAANRLTVGASGLVPGDTVQRAVQLQNTGSEDLASVWVTTTAGPSSLLDTSAAMGLQMTVDRCSVPWTESGTAPAYIYTCSGTQASVVSSRPVIGANIPMAGLTAITSGSTDHLRVTLTLPTTADNTLQGQSSTLTFAFTGLQRAGTAK